LANFQNDSGKGICAMSQGPFDETYIRDADAGWEKKQGSASSGQQPNADDLAPAFSDEALALRFADRHANDLRYVPAWSRWLTWDGKRWAPDEKLKVFTLARNLCREAANEANSGAAAIASRKKVAAVEQMARADQRLVVTIDDLDADPWVLNTPAGTLDLRSGKLRPHSPDDKLTKITGAAPDRSCATPVWDAFLARITDNQPELIAFLKRVAGYALTGLTREHALFFLYGRGANGKSTLINVLLDCLGDYHRAAPIETFTASQSDRHPTDLAGLRGARLVTATETEEGRRWAESKIKALTGGDRISARFMRQDFFEYTPQFKLLIAGNHKPGLRSVDEAIRRRFNLLPFTVTIPPGERDADLPAKLQTELPGIMAWMVEGCLEWQKRGLVPPKVVTDATDAYLEAEDVLSTWMEECGAKDPHAWEPSAKLWTSWVEWAGKSGEHVGSQKQFHGRLEGRLEAKRGSGGARGYRGFRLFPPKSRYDFNPD
jgi:putative DNA primase/helicase